MGQSGVLPIPEQGPGGRDRAQLIGGFHPLEDQLALRTQGPANGDDPARQRRPAMRRDISAEG